MNCALCDERLTVMNVSVFHPRKYSMFHICFDCYNIYNKDYAHLSQEELALHISAVVEDYQAIKMNLVKRANMQTLHKLQG